MGIRDRANVLGFLAQNAEAETPSIAEQRARLDALQQFFPVPSGTRFEAATIGGVRGEWVRAPEVPADCVLLYLHGGGYVIGSPASHRHLAAAISMAAGVSVYSADYRLAPENPFPAAVDDAVAVYRGLIAAGVSPAKLAIAGDSAGGGLTIATLVALKEKGVPLPACAIAISPWVDLSRGGEAHRARLKRDPIVSKEALDEMAAAYLAGTDPRTPLASPLFADLGGLPPLLIQVGTEDALYDDAMALKARAEAAGVGVSAESWDGMVHVWHVFHPILSEARDAIARVGAFLRSHLE